MKSSNEKIYVAGHRGMVGSAIYRTLRARHEANIITRSRSELDLTNQSDVNNFFDTERPQQVYLAAAKVGGIMANHTLPAEFLYQNLMIQSNVIDAAFRSGVKRLLFLGSSCIYPKITPQPIPESALLSGQLEPTNEPYAIAKIAGIKLCESYNRQYGSSHGLDYRSVMPTNLYGPGDNYQQESSHVIPALLRRFHEAKVAAKPAVVVWGSGAPRREFLYVDDMAAACVFVMNLPRSVYSSVTTPMLSHVNVGCGHDVTISELARLIAEVVGYEGRIEFDSQRPDGTPRKLMNSTLLTSLGWSSSVSLRDGIKMTYQSFLNTQT
jgi:GDP-L-fucose synthase